MKGEDVRNLSSRLLQHLEHKEETVKEAERKGKLVKKKKMGEFGVMEIS